LGGLFSLQNTAEGAALDLVLFATAAATHRYLDFARLQWVSPSVWQRELLLALRRAATIRRLRKQRDRLLAAAEKGSRA